MAGVYVKVGDILTCYCNNPLAKRVSRDTFEILRFYRGKKVSVKVTHNSGTHRIGCPDCGYNYVCIKIIDSFCMTDKIAVSSV